MNFYQLISGDVASNELYYHKSCYKTFLSRYQQKISKKLNSNKEMRKNKENLVKAMRQSQIVNQVYDQEQYESVSSFEDFVKLLKKVVKPIWMAMKNINNKFSGNLVQNCQQKDISGKLITLVSMLTEGNNISIYTSQNI